MEDSKNLATTAAKRLPKLETATSLKSATARAVNIGNYVTEI